MYCWLKKLSVKVHSWAWKQTWTQSLKRAIQLKARFVYYFQCQEWTFMLKKTLSSLQYDSHAVDYLVCFIKNFVSVLEAANDEETSMVSNEPDVEYTEVVHPPAADSARGKYFTHTNKKTYCQSCFVSHPSNSITLITLYPLFLIILHFLPFHRRSSC